MLAIFWQPKKEDEFRKWWQIYHRFLGCAVISLIIANIFVGINNQSQAEKLKLVYAVILGGLALIALALEIFRCFTYKILHRSMELNSNMDSCPWVWRVVFFFFFSHIWFILFFVSFLIRIFIIIFRRFDRYIANPR